MYCTWNCINFLHYSASVALDSEAALAMQEAQENGIFIIKSYEETKAKSGMTDLEFQRLLMQEYAFWLIVTQW